MNLLWAALALALPAAAQSPLPPFDSGPFWEHLLPDPPAPPRGAEVSAPAVILVTWDGVRWQEFFRGVPDPALSSDRDPIFPRFWGRRAAEGVVLGDPAKGGKMLIANTSAVSLPAYQSLMAGGPQPCFTNRCSRIAVETLPERLLRELKLRPEEAPAFLAWSGIRLAVERQAGRLKIEGPALGEPSHDDAAIWAKAMDALKTRPRFLYVALDDADDHAHEGDYAAYLRDLREYDLWLDELLSSLDALGAWGKAATVIVTTDHGRGEGADWKHHNIRYGGARVFLYARGRRVPAKGSVGGFGTHAGVRPTVEELLGLRPSGFRLPVLD